MGFLCTIRRVFLAAAIAAFAGPAVAQPAGFVEIAQISFTHPYYGDRPVPVVTQLGTTAQHANRLMVNRDTLRIIASSDSPLDQPILLYLTYRDPDMPKVTKFDGAFFDRNVIYAGQASESETQVSLSQPDVAVLLERSWPRETFAIVQVTPTVGKVLNININFEPVPIAMSYYIKGASDSLSIVDLEHQITFQRSEDVELHGEPFAVFQADTAVPFVPSALAGRFEAIDTPDFGPSTQVDLPIPSAANLPWPDDRDLPSLPADIFVILK